MSRYVRPFNSYKRASAFTCPHCGVLSSHEMLGDRLSPQRASQTSKRRDTWANGLYLLACVGCGEHTVFFKKRMVYPTNPTGPAAIDGMPEEIRTDYEEGRIADASPRAAAALLRLAVQKLCKLLGEGGKNINDDIASLVKKGLSVEVQRALDIVRVIGNNAVHPGQIDLEDSPQTCQQLFALVNMITDRMLVEPKQLEELYLSLPQSSLDQIEKRDNG